MNFLRAFRGAFSTAPRDSPAPLALPPSESVPDGEGESPLALAVIQPAASTMVPLEVDEIVSANEWNIIRTMAMPSVSREEDISDVMHALALEYAHPGLSKHRHHVPKDGLTESWEYRCKSRYNGCQYRAKVVLERTPTGQVIEISTIHDHSNHASTAGKGLCPEVKEFLRRNFKMKPMAAHSYLMRSYPMHRNVTLQQVQNFFGNHNTAIKAKRFAHTQSSWRNYCEQHPWSPHDPPDHVSVIYFKFDAEDFHCALSTNRLLRAVIEQRKHAPAYKQADATWKITWEGHPVLVVGTVMWGGTFVPTAWMLSGNERQQDYAAVEVAVQEKLGALAKPDETHLVNVTPFCCADGALAIKWGERNATRRADRGLEPDKLLTCYSHMLRGAKLLARKHLRGEQKERMVSEVVADLQALEGLPFGFRRAFDLLVDMWMDKWNGRGQSQFVGIFRDSWLLENKRWSRAFVPVGLPNSTNNLERNNRSMKDILSHARTEATGAIEHIADGVVGWWSEHKLGDTPFPAGPVDREDMWVQVQEYERKVTVPALLGIEDGDLALYPTRDTIAVLHRRDAEKPTVAEKERVERIAGEGTDLARQCANLWRQLRYLGPGDTVELEESQTTDFDTVMSLLRSFRVLTPLANPYPGCRARWQCWSCGDGQKQGVCKHSLLQTKRKGETTMPDEFRHLTNGEKRKRGAPRKTAPALVKQVGDFLPPIASPQPALEDVPDEVVALPEPEPRVTRARASRTME